MIVVVVVVQVYDDDGGAEVGRFGQDDGVWVL